MTRNPAKEIEDLRRDLKYMSHRAAKLEDALRAFVWSCQEDGTYPLNLEAATKALHFDEEAIS